MSSLKDRRDRVRWWLYAPLAVVIAAGAISGGVGVGSADTGTDLGAAPASTGDLNWWSLYNDTGKPIYGEWSEQIGSATSVLTIVKDVSEPQGGHESRPRISESAHLFSDPYWMGHICYDHKQWNLDRRVRHVSTDAHFTLIAPSTGNLDVMWGEASSGGGKALTSSTVTRVEHLVENKAEAPC